MRKNLYLPLIIVVSLFLTWGAFGGCGPKSSQPTNRRHADSEQSKAGKDSPMSPSDTSVSPDQKTIAKPYPILGVSDRLNAKERLNMDKWRKDILMTAIRHPGEVYLNGEPNKKEVALTFDDGPDGFDTPQILDILQRYAVQAGFFCIGEQVRRFPKIVRRADREGQLVLNHTWSHADLSHRNNQDIDREVDLTEDEIASVIGKRPALIRPPYGAVNDTVIGNLAGKHDQIIIWSIDTLDWSQREKINIVNNVLANIRPGDIVLMHSCPGRQATVEALPEIITGLRAKGYILTRLDKMLNISAYR